MKIIDLECPIFTPKNVIFMPEKEQINAATPAPATVEAPAMPKYRERLRGRYSDVEPKSDQEWDDLTERGFAEDEEKIKLFEDNTKVIQDILDSDKDASAVISEMIVNGTPFRAAVAKFFDPEDLVAKEGDEDYEYYQKSTDERRKMGQAFRERSAEKRKNETEAYDNIDKFAEKLAMDAAAKDAFVSFINELYNDLSVLKLSEKTLEKLYKAMNYDKDVAEAAETGEIDGKNQAIEAARVKKSAATAGDGVPTPQGGSTPAPAKPEKKPSFFDDLPKRKFQ